MTLAPASGVRIGPTGIPEKTLGWDVLAWTGDYLLQPDGPNAGKPWRFTDEQARFVLWWYAIDETGRFIYRKGMLRRMKGWGKDPVGAALCAVEFVGPCRFGGWRPDGQPIVIPHSAAWVQTAAVSKDQTRNTMTLFPGMLSPAAIDEYGIDLGKEIIYAHRGRCRLEAVTSSPRALEGGRATFVLKNETHHWIQSNEGLAMSEVIARNAAKSRDGASRVLAISNAHNPGESSDAEEDYRAWVEQSSGRTVVVDMLYDSVEAPPDVELVVRGTGALGEVTEEDRARARESVRQGLLATRGDSVWLDVDRLLAEIMDPRTPVTMSRRFYLNQLHEDDEAWITPQEWDRCAVKPDVRPIQDGDQITLGFDGSTTNDHSALIGCRVEDGLIFPLGMWDPEDNALKQVPQAVVDGTVRNAFARFDVVGFYSDYHPFEAWVDTWEAELAEDLCVRPPGGHAIRCVVAGGTGQDSTRQIITVATDAYRHAIIDGFVSHTNDPKLNQYHYNARRRPNAHGVAIAKESPFSSRKIDGAVAALLAWKARQDYLALPEHRKRQQVEEAGAFWA